MSRIWATVNNRIYSIHEDRIAYFLSEKNQSFGITKSGVKFNSKLDLSKLSNLVSESKFYRINQELLVNTTSIVGFEKYFEDTSVIKLRPQLTADVLINKDQEANLIQFMGIQYFH